MDRKAARREHPSEKNTLAYPCVYVFSKNVAGGHFSISNPISLRDPVSVAVLSSLVTEQERGPQCHTGLLSGHTGVI